MDTLIWIGLIIAFMIMVIWPLFDAWFDDLKSDYDKEDWWSYIDNDKKDD